MRANSGFTLETSGLIETGAPIKLKTEKECAVGVAFYPDFAYNAEGGIAPGESASSLNRFSALRFASFFRTTIRLEHPKHLIKII